MTTASNTASNFMKTLKTSSRTIFKSSWLLTVFTLMVCQADVSAQSLDESKYTVIENPLTVSTGEKIEVLELFWYGCPHCFSLEPFVKSWIEEKPDNAEFVKVPAMLSSSWGFGAQAFYTMEALGVLEEASDTLFHQIHVIKKPVNNLNALITFLEKYEKTSEEVTSAFNSFAVDTKVRNAGKISRMSTAQGVPAFLVDGKYHTSVTLAGGQDELFEVINQLVEKAASER